MAWTILCSKWLLSAPFLSNELQATMTLHTAKPAGTPGLSWVLASTAWQLMSDQIKRAKEDRSKIKLLYGEKFMHNRSNHGQLGRLLKTALK